MNKKYEAMVLSSCIDPRCQSKLYNILKKKKLTKNTVLLILLGSAIGVTSNQFKNWHEVFWKNLDISIKLHGIKKLIVLNHTDCGAAKLQMAKKIFN